MAKLTTKAEFLYQVDLPDGVDAAVAAAAMDAVMNAPARWEAPSRADARFPDAFPMGWQGAGEHPQRVRKAAEPLALALLEAVRGFEGAVPAAAGGGPRPLSPGGAKFRDGGKHGARGVLVGAFGAGDPEAAAAVTSAVLKHFGLDPFWFEWREPEGQPAPARMGAAACSPAGGEVIDLSPGRRPAAAGGRRQPESSRPGPPRP